MPTIKHLGELAIRVHDLAAMKAFYTDVVGLEVFNDDLDELVFFKAGEAVDGHPQLFGMFDRPTTPGAGERRRLDHFAFVIDLADYETEKARLEGLGVAVVIREFPHFHWRSLFFSDPEGNTVEFVAYDASV